MLSISLEVVTRLLIASWPQIAEYITGHSDITPSRKSGPGPAFDWIRFLAALCQPGI
ncbi:N-acetyl-anhydromuranmyl-L-alanine amidase [Erwinia tracheiphila PSU-1]|nr:N-acetyl-anhydromuranmyl-L-alanine amidase [Erwinia tracheiphila PSU-1]